MAAPFDPSDYVRAPIITLTSGVTLALALVDACPKTAPANVKKACKHLKTTAETARDQLAERNRALGVYTDEDSRILDNEADRAWGGFRMRIQAMAMLSAKEFPQAKRAADLDVQLFAGGMEFLKAEYGAQSTSMAAILERIESDGLAKEIDDIAGPQFLKALRHVQPRYEAMVKERLRRDNAIGQNLSEMTRTLQAAIVNHASKIIGTIEHDEPDTLEAARLALLPISNFRDAAAGRAQRAAKDEAPAPAPAKPDPS